MSRWRVLRAGACSALILLALWWSPRAPIPPAEAQGVGIYARATCTQITSAERGRTFCFDQTANALRVWDGSFWRLISFATVTESVALGGTPSQRFLMNVTGTATITDANSGAGLRVDPTLTAAANQDLYIIDVGGTLTAASGSTHSVFAAVNLNATSINFATGTVTDSAMLRIGGALAGASNAYAYLQDGGTMFLRNTAALRTATANHAFGTTPDTRALLILGGLTVGTSEAYSVLVAGDASPALNNSAMQVRLTGTIHRANSGTHPLGTTLTVEEPGFIGGTAAVTDTATVLIRSVSPVGGSNYPLWIATSSQSPAGVAIRAEGFASFTQSTAIPPGPAIGNSNASLMLVSGSTGGVIINNQTNTVQNAQFENAGGMTLGTPTGLGRGVGTLNFASATYGNGQPILVASTASINLLNVRGIAASQTLSNNLRGTCNFAAATTCVTQFGNNEPDAHYFVAISCAGTNPVGVSAKTRAGFTLTATVSNSNTCDYIVIR